MEENVSQIPRWTAVGSHTTKDEVKNLNAFQRWESFLFIVVHNINLNILLILYIQLFSAICTRTEFTANEWVRMKTVSFSIPTSWQREDMFFSTPSSHTCKASFFMSSCSPMSTDYFAFTVLAGEQPRRIVNLQNFSQVCGRSAKKRGGTFWGWKDEKESHRKNG